MHLYRLCLIVLAVFVSSLIFVGALRLGPIVQIVAEGALLGATVAPIALLVAVDQLLL